MVITYVIRFPGGILGINGVNFNIGDGKAQSPYLSEIMRWCQIDIRIGRAINH